MVFWGLEGHLKGSQHMTEGVSYADGLPPETGLVHHKGIRPAGPSHHRKTWFKEMTHTDISCFISRPA